MLTCPSDPEQMHQIVGPGFISSSRFKRTVSLQGLSVLAKLSLITFSVYILPFGVVVSYNFFFHPNLHVHAVPTHTGRAFMMLKYYVVKFSAYFINSKKQHINDMELRRNSGSYTFIHHLCQKLCCNKEHKLTKHFFKLCHVSWFSAG